jgi:hypothetical protein
VLIKDESNGVTRFDFNYSIQVWPDKNLKNQLIMDLVNKDVTSELYSSLKSGNLKAVAESILGLVSMLNAKPNVSNSTGNVTIDPVEMNNIAIARTELTNALSSITISDMSSMKLISAALDGISKDTTQTTRDSAEKSAEKNIALLESLKSMCNGSSAEDTQLVASSIISGMGNGLNVNNLQTPSYYYRQLSLFLLFNFKSNGL